MLSSGHSRVAWRAGDPTKRFSRRRFFRVVGWPALGLAVAAVVGCGSDEEAPLATPSGSPDAGRGTTSPAATATVAAGVRFDPDLHVIVDKKRKLPDGFTPRNVEAIPAAWHSANASGQRLRADVIAAIRPMVEAALADHVVLRIESAYRSYDEQVSTFNYWVSVVGEKQARRESAEPGHSEHQLATTVDFADASNGWQLVESFAGTPSGRWLAANAHRFGFALSYPPDSEAITGYIYEPWHYRYIGVAAAQEWRASGKTLVEYLEALKARG
jgi:zinc D-Ala-D-Ala carboxypeptidase